MDTVKQIDISRAEALTVTSILHHINHHKGDLRFDIKDLADTLEEMFEISDEEFSEEYDNITFGEEDLAHSTEITLGG